MTQVDPVLFAKALADETRQEIMKRLCCCWLSVNDLVEQMEGRVNQPTVSHHLKKLEEAGLVDVRQEGRYRFYTLNQERLTVCCGALVTTFAPEYQDTIAPVFQVTRYNFDTERHTEQPTVQQAG
jgi:ArsR family transcriptional regulator